MSAEEVSKVNGAPISKTKQGVLFVILLTFTLSITACYVLFTEQQLAVLCLWLFGLVAVLGILDAVMRYQMQKASPPPDSHPHQHNRGGTARNA